jgi:hypothetical protein
MTIPKKTLTQAEKLLLQFQGRICVILAIAFPNDKDLKDRITFFSEKHEAWLALEDGKRLRLSRHAFTNRLLVDGTWPTHENRAWKPAELRPMTASWSLDDQYLAKLISERFMSYYDIEFERLHAEMSAELARRKEAQGLRDELAAVAGVNLKKVAPKQGTSGDSKFWADNISGHDLQVWVEDGEFYLEIKTDVERCKKLLAFIRAGGAK